MDHDATLEGTEDVLGQDLLGHAADAGTSSIPADCYGLK
jgi:hypothetical protein